MLPQVWLHRSYLNSPSKPSKPQTKIFQYIINIKYNQTENYGDMTFLLLLIIIAVTYLDSHWLAQLN